MNTRPTHNKAMGTVHNNNFVEILPAKISEVIKYYQIASLASMTGEFRITAVIVISL